ncbi:uncharacterized protein LOC120779364, partial [Bactrocera tryoni]|uniref:uncharacterized protein LOC120779364 n=1 Tax=Bactrocera tryoni TaxID=59916 RepID=UPI001A9603BA
MHNDADIADSGKPEIIEYYNRTKGGVNRMDQMFAEYPTQRQIKRWPLAMFFNMLDITALAAYIVYDLNNPMLPWRTHNKRKQILRSLAEALCMPIIEARAINRQVTRNFPTKMLLKHISTDRWSQWCQKQHQHLPQRARQNLCPDLAIYVTHKRKNAVEKPESCAPN